MTRLGETEMVIGRYSLFAPIASGGMGTVHFGTVVENGEKHIVAVKRLHPHLRNDQSFAMMLLDEARLSTMVHHPNVVQVLDCVSTPTDLLLVMEYVQGLSVYELMTQGLSNGQRAPMPLQVAITIAVDGLMGLHAAHEAVNEEGQPLNLVHRDISPHNLLVDAAGMTKLTDFGVAKAVGRLRSTHDGSIRGKIAYMSPEQVADSPLDARADIYSFAVTLWELIAGRPMFEAETDVALFAKAMRGPTVRVSELADVPPAVDAAIWRALARDPRRRYPTARAFADALVDGFGAVDRDWVATWMHERAGSLLAQRAETIHSILTSPPPSADDLDVPTRVHELAPGSGPLDITSPPMMLEYEQTARNRAGREKNRNVQLGMIGVAGAAAVAAIFMLTQSRKHAEHAPELPPAPTVAASQPPPPPDPPPTAAPVATPSVTTAVAAPAPKSKARPARRSEKDAKADCNPPYTEDEQGKHFKPWCLR